LYGEEGMVIARKVFDVVEEVLTEKYGSMDKLPKDIHFNGTLTSFDTVPEELRGDMLERLKSRYLFERAFPVELSISLSKYENPPGRWLWERQEPEGGYDEEQRRIAEKQLARIIDDCWNGRNQNSTWAKMGLTSALFSSGRVMLPDSIASDWGNLLPRYPHDLTEDEVRRVESSMRAMYQGMSRIMLTEEKRNAVDDWAKEFWRSNWKLYACVDEEDAPESDGDDEKQMIKYHKELHSYFADLTERFFKAAGVDPDLYNPVRHEVLSGIVSRSRRAVAIVLGNPMMWSSEHGSGTIRALVEARIVLAWLIFKDDPSLYVKFQEYGRGHLKLLKLHLEAYVDKQENPSPELLANIEELDAMVNRDVSEEFQNISIESNFAGVSVRKMAEDVGMLDDYRFLFAPASSTFHGEWPALDQFALVQCTNPMHRGHRVVRKNDGVVVGSHLVNAVLNELESLIELYESGISSTVDE
jgi:hypothetical protein